MIRHVGAATTGSILIKPYYEKTDLFAYAKTKLQISCALTAQLISTFVFRFKDSTTPCLLKFKISSFSLSPVTVEACLCQTWSESLKTGSIL